MRKYLEAFLDLIFNPGEENNQEKKYTNMEMILCYVLLIFIVAFAVIALP